MNTGLRLGKLLGLQWGDIDLDEQVLHVRRQWTLTRTLDLTENAERCPQSVADE